MGIGIDFWHQTFSKARNLRSSTVPGLEPRRIVPSGTTRWEMRHPAKTLYASWDESFANCGQFFKLTLVVRVLLFTMQANGFAWFLNKEIAKSLVSYLVFRHSISAHIPVIMADFAPEIFRNVPHPPMETLAFLGASVSSSLRAFVHLNNSLY